MENLLPTIIIRHKKENLKKCSLKGLEKNEDVVFYTYPITSLPSLENYILLSLDAEEILSKEDQSYGLLLLDATWRYAHQMEKNLPLPPSIKKRKIPAHFSTAYPRRQQDCPHPDLGLASIEALFIAFALTQRKTEGLLENYHWRNEFLQKNAAFLQKLGELCI